MYDIHDLAQLLIERGHIAHVDGNDIVINGNHFTIFNQNSVYNAANGSIPGDIRSFRTIFDKRSDFIIISNEIAFAFELQGVAIINEEFWYAELGNVRLIDQYINPDLVEVFYRLGQYVHLLDFDGL
jgi:hypothetical protein